MPATNVETLTNPRDSLPNVYTNVTAREVDFVTRFGDNWEALRNIPEVVECHYTTGDYDMFIKIYAHNNHHLLTVIHDQLQPLGLSRSETIISFGSAFNKQLPIVDFKEA